MNPGDVSDVIEDRGGFYVVKLVSRVHGGVRSFEDEAVQDEIRQTLRGEQLRKLEQEDVQRLLENAVVRTDPQMIDAAVQMAMENYPRWAKP
jgi:parvulin-like peptidyl-prolyl isomerase